MSQYKLVLVAKGLSEPTDDGKRYGTIEEARNAATMYFLGANDKVRILDTYDGDKLVDIWHGASQTR